MDNEFNPIQLAKVSDTFCIYPWIHQYVGTSGDVKPCCVYRHTAELGSLKENTLAEIWNNDKTKKLRLKLLNGEEEPNCSHCNDNARIVTNPRYNGHKVFFKNENINILMSTLPDGSVPEHKLNHIDIRFNNLCNFACRTCSPHFSTNWIADYRKLYNLSVKQDINDEFQFPGKTEEQVLEEILPHIKSTKSIYFAGGEPLIQEEHYVVLQQLIKYKNLNCSIVYNTNLSKIKLGNHNVIEYWNQFARINLNASIDGSYKKAEYWRHGTVWDDIVNNFKQIKKECSRVFFNISFSLSWVNAHNAVELHREWIEMGYINPKQFIFNIIDGPKPYSIKNIPSWKKEKIKKIFMDHIEWLNQNNSPDTVSVSISMFLEAIIYMESKPEVDIHTNLKEFSRLTKKLDEIRNENFIETFPEHQDIYDYMTEHNLHATFKY
jgi:pyruvate-formate lyase-activating enzyme